MRGIIALALLMVTGGYVLADNVVPELSRRTLIPVSELDELLSDCQKTQLAMNICAARDSVAADIKMDRMLSQALLSIDKSCRLALTQAQINWKKHVGFGCDQEANAEAEDGSMRPMVYNSCIEAATIKRTKELAKIKACKNVR